MVNPNDITVIIATAGERPELLERAAESVRNQTEKVDNILIGLDIHKNGPAEVRNEMAAKVETDFLLFLDDDDYLFEDYIATVLPFLDDNDVVYTWCDRNFDAQFDLEFSRDRLRVGNTIPLTSVIRKAMFDLVLGFPIGVAYEDWGLWIELLDEDARFHCIKEKKWMYEKQPQNRTQENEILVAQRKIASV
jgi:glycosyltransferase involved in cell wall biosynthesis